MIIIILHYGLQYISSRRERVYFFRHKRLIGNNFILKQTFRFHETTCVIVIRSIYPIYNLSLYRLMQLINNRELQSLFLFPNNCLFVPIINKNPQSLSTHRNSLQAILSFSRFIGNISRYFISIYGTNILYTSPQLYGNIKESLSIRHRFTRHPNLFCTHICPNSANSAQNRIFNHGFLNWNARKRTRPSLQTDSISYLKNCVCHIW